jgi:hypothetical protein
MRQNWQCSTIRHVGYLPGALCDIPLQGTNRIRHMPSQFAVPIMCEVESLLSDAPLRIRAVGLESRRSYAET